MTTTFRDLVALTTLQNHFGWLIFIEFINGQFVGDVVGSGYILLLLHAPDIHEEKQSISNLFHSATRYYYPREYWQVGRMYVYRWYLYQPLQFHSCCCCCCFGVCVRIIREAVHDYGTN